MMNLALSTAVYETSPQCEQQRLQTCNTSVGKHLGVDSDIAHIHRWRQAQMETVSEAAVGGIVVQTDWLQAPTV